MEEINKEGVVVYSTPGCSKCLMLKNVLKSKDIDFLEENDIEKVMEKASKLGVSELPIFNVGEDWYSGNSALEIGRGM